MLRAYTDVYDYLTMRGYKPRLRELHNETSNEVKSFMKDRQEKYQYTAYQMHATNNAEKTLQTWKIILNLA